MEDMRSTLRRRVGFLANHAVAALPDSCSKTDAKALKNSIAALAVQGSQGKGPRSHVKRLELPWLFAQIHASLERLLAEVCTQQ